MYTSPPPDEARLPRCAYLVCGLATATLLCVPACNRSNPYLATQPGGYSPLLQGQSPGLNAASWQGTPAGDAAQMAVVAQMQELEKRTRLLDENNRQLTTQLAQVQQRSDLHRERAELLASQLQDASRQLQEATIAQQRQQQEIIAARTEVNGMQASMKSRGGATLVANSSLQKTADSLSASGFPAIVDGRVVRISVPADQLFQPGSATLLPAAGTTLERIEAALVSTAANNRIGIEAHTDGGAGQPGYGPHQLSALQASAVVEQIQRRGRVSAAQLFSVAHGFNHPVADSTSDAGRARNRRIEFAVYPDRI